jgi:hypothetical protein
MKFVMYSAKGMWRFVLERNKNASLRHLHLVDPLIRVRYIPRLLVYLL